MNKFIGLNIFFIIFLVGLVSAIGQVNIAAVTSPSGNPGDTVQINATVENAVVAGPILTIILQSSNLISGSNTITPPSIPSITNLANATPQITSFNVVIPTILAGTYSGSIYANESGNEAANNHTFPYSVTVQSIHALDVQTYDNSSNPLTITSQEDETKTVTFDVKNTGSNAFTLTNSLITYTQSDFSDDDNDTVALTFKDFNAVNPGETDTITLTAVIEDGIDLDTYTGLITVKNPNDNTKTDTFNLEVRIQPEVCKDGIVKDGDPSSRSQALLQIDVNDPDDGDEYNLGDTVDIDVTVNNEDDKDMDVVVEAFLYDLDDNDEITTVESDSININDDDEEDFTLELKIPQDPDLDEDHDYTIFIKAYEDGDEDQNCNEESIEIDIEKNDHDVVIDEILVNPSTVSCGESVSVDISVVNIGNRDEDGVYIDLKSTALKIDQRSNSFDLDKGDDLTKNFVFNIPSDAEDKTHDLEAIVYFDDGDEKKGIFGNIVVQCKGQVVSLPDVGLSVNEDEIVAKENSFSIPVKITNNANNILSLVLDLDASWANPVDSKTLTLDSGQSSTIFLLLEAREGETGRKTALLELKHNNEVVATETVVFELGEESKGIGIDLSNLGGNTAFWIVADVVAILIVLYVLKLVFLPKKP
ncbi:putative S-layer protein [Candidatus Woesearchaeota archaeon]|nr:putative S-layer protein [Candidatus Woesearchaeota archaeon]